MMLIPVFFFPLDGEKILISDLRLTSVLPSVPFSYQFDIQLGFVINIVVVSLLRSAPQEAAQLHPQPHHPRPHLPQPHPQPRLQAAPPVPQCLA